MDEPDVVKTDGRRVVALVGGGLQVVDVATHRVTGTLRLPGGTPTDMVVSGDRALLTVPGREFVPGAAEPDAQPAPAQSADTGAAGAGSDASAPQRTVDGRAQLVLVDLAPSTPRVLGRYTVDGRVADARQVGSTVRVVVHSQLTGPHLGPDTASPGTASPDGYEHDSDEATAREARLRAAVRRSTIADWMPRYTVSDGNGAPLGGGQLTGCGQVSRPAVDPGGPGYSGTSMMTVLSFDLAADPNAPGSVGGLGDGRAVSVLSDADTVYASPTALYLANGYQAPSAADASAAPGAAAGAPTRASSSAMAVPRTAIYRFDISGSADQRPRLRATGDVEGRLVDQYALSEFDGRLRVATTVTHPSTVTPAPGTGSSRVPLVEPAPAIAPVRPPDTEGVVTVLGMDGPRLTPVGRLGGLGRGERVQAVRFAGTLSYVVTFRQTDPLYTVDLTDPTHPVATGELKLTGFSSYLQPAGQGRMVGVGQEATTTGVSTGLQVSLFDVSGPAAKRTDSVQVPGGRSQAQSNPHAFLYWPADGTIALPVQTVADVMHPMVPQPSTPARTPGTRPATASPSTSTSSGVIAAPIAPGEPAPVRADSSLLVLRVKDGRLVQVGRVRQSSASGQSVPITRSLVVGDELWTLSSVGLQVNALSDLALRATLPLS